MGILPKAMDVAVRSGVEGARFLDFHPENHLMVGVNGSGIGALNRFSMGIESEVAHIVGIFIPLRVEVNAYPADVVLSGVGVRDFFSDANFYLEKFASFDLRGGFNYRDMLFGFPIGFLIKLAYHG